MTKKGKIKKFLTKERYGTLIDYCYVSQEVEESDDLITKTLKNVSRKNNWKNMIMLMKYRKNGEFHKGLEEWFESRRSVQCFKFELIIIEKQ